MTQTNEITFPKAYTYPAIGIYTAYRDRNGTEDEIAIVCPTGKPVACIQFWDEPDTNQAAEAEADAQVIVAALNAFNHTDPKRMTTEQLEKHVHQLHCNWMYHEAAERGYDYAAANQASREHSEAKAELDKRKESEKGILELAADLQRACDGLVASNSAA